jgi:hypothetical protein
MKKRIIVAVLVPLTLIFSTCHPVYARRGPYRPAPPIGPSWRGSVEAAVWLRGRDKLGKCDTHISVIIYPDKTATVETDPPLLAERIVKTIYA